MTIDEFIQKLNKADVNNIHAKHHSPNGDEGHEQMTQTPRQASVIVPCLRLDHGDHILFTKRAADLKHHAGQISFPGGRVDDEDDTILSAGLRELREEINHPEDQVELVAQLPNYHTITGFQVTPFVCTLTPPFHFIAEASEVDEIFTVPLAHICNEDNYQRFVFTRAGQKRHYYAIDYKDYHIWGATAGILYGLIKSINKI